jgi:phosphate starvation-inducible membrane PsiE
MSRGDAALANVLFLLFAAITTVSTFLIVQHFRSRKLAIVLTVAVLVFFVALYLSVKALLRSLGL